MLTVLSCIAGNARVRSAMAHCQARRRLVDFSQRVPDPRLRARALSLIKVGAPFSRLPNWLPLFLRFACLRARTLSLIKMGASLLLFCRVAWQRRCCG